MRLKSLNPYYNGKYSMRLIKEIKEEDKSES